MRHSRFLLTILAVPMLVLVGCGDDDDGDASSSESTSTTAESTSDAAFAEQVNASCAASGAAIGEIFGPMSQLDGPPPQELLQSTYDALLAQLRGEQAELEAMTPPADQQADWDELVTAHADAIAVVEEQGLAFLDDDDTNPFAEVESMAVEMGFDACGGGEG